MNKVILIGNLTKKPELRMTQTGKSVATASIATNKSYIDKDGNKQDVTQFHNLVIWGKPAQAFEKYLEKGKKVAIVGELQHRNYEGQDGVKRYITEVLVNEFHFLSPATKRPDPVEPPEMGGDVPVADDGEINVANIPF